MGVPANEVLGRGKVDAHHQVYQKSRMDHCIFLTANHAAPTELDSGAHGIVVRTRELRLKPEVDVTARRARSYPTVRGLPATRF